MNSVKSRALPVVEWDKLPALLTEYQVAQIINVSVHALRKARCEGVTGSRTPMPPFVRVGGRIRYRLSDVLAWVDALEAREAI
ncbi:MAG: helix-turn-helix domain-containing protein [Synergistaceae bacterium]|nr:helix-turn-helix domain-containing protein [Synergistaceae bacterium]